MSKGELVAEKAAALSWWRVGEASSKDGKIAGEFPIAAFTSPVRAAVAQNVI